eukprot:scaffold436_cov55-Cyclotella_meneghiniana.AAC.3
MRRRLNDHHVGVLCAIGYGIGHLPFADLPLPSSVQESIQYILRNNDCHHNSILMVDLYHFISGYKGRLSSFQSLPLPCKSSTTAFPMTKSPNELLRKKILEGAVLKVADKKDSDDVGDSIRGKPQSDVVMSECADDVKQCTYYVRQASRSGA